MTKTALQIDHLARIEGHGDVYVSLKDGLVERVEMRVVEPARLFESMVRNRSYKEVSYISSRICGICSSSHVVTDLKAIENAFGISVSGRTDDLRELLVYGSYLQNHATHLFVLAAPDFVGLPSVFPLAQSSPELFSQALALKALGNELCTKVGGRSVHPITAVVGGFTHEIAPHEYRSLAEDMEAMVPFALEAVDLFGSFSVPALATEGDMLAMVGEDCYPIARSERARLVRSGTEFFASDISAHIEEYEVAHSGALFARLKETGGPYMTSALARINASWQHLGAKAKMAAAKVGLRPPEANPFMNNIAQAVEIVDALDRCSAICRRLAEDDAQGSSAPVAFTPKAGRGIGFTEAPRGALFHEVTFDGAGKVVGASIMTPTAQNVANLEADMRRLAELLVAEGRSEEELRQGIEKLIRAYDPCLSCSVH